MEFSNKKRSKSKRLKRYQNQAVTYRQSNKQILSQSSIDFIQTLALQNQKNRLNVYNYLLTHSLMNNLYVSQEGTLIPRDPQKAPSPQFTVITYRHTIRQLPESNCNCKEQKDRLKKQYQVQLDQKDAEIIALVNRIADKETQISQLQAEITSMRNPEILHHKPITKNDNSHRMDQGLCDKIEKTLNSTVTSLFLLGDISTNDFANGNHYYQINKTEQQMQDCFKKTSIIMKDIEGIMKKKRKYDFYNSIYVENKIIEEIDNSEEKNQQNTQEISMEDTFCRPMSEYNDEYSLDMTTFESVQNFGQNSGDEMFYSKLIQDSIQLRNIIIQMREESVQEIRQIEQYYQKQLEISYEELEKEKKRNGLIEMTKNKLNDITNKGRQALAQLDQNEGFSWDVGDKKLLKKSIIMDENNLMLLT